MKEIKRVSFNEIILIPAQDKFEGDYPLSHYIGSMEGRSGNSTSTVHILIFNCSNILEIVELIDQEIENLKDYISKNPEVKEISTQVGFFSNLKKEIEDPCLHHEPSNELFVRLSNKGFHELDKNNLFFLSGVSSLVEI